MSKLKTQLSQKTNAIANQAPLTASAQNLPSYPPANNAPIGGDRHPLAQSKLSDPRPRLVSPPCDPQIQVEAYSATGGFGYTPRTTTSQLTAIFNHQKTFSEQVGLKDLKREEDFIELRLQKFDEFCSLQDIQSESDRYKLLESLVCLRDTQTFRDKYEAESRDYQGLKKFLIGGEGRLNHVFTAVQLSHSITYTELDREVTRVVAELRNPDILRKFVTIHLAPAQLQKEIKNNLHLKGDKFDIAVARICDRAAQKRKASAMNNNYTNHKNPPRQARDERTKPKRNEQKARHKNSGTKKMLESGITGRVVWFNIRKGYGFIHRDDQDTDIFVHQTAITRNNPNKFLRSVAQGEVVQFDVIMGNKNMPEARNVSGPNGKPVKGSKYAPKRWQSYKQQINRQQRPQQNNYISNGCFTLRNRHQCRGRPNNYRRRYIYEHDQRRKNKCYEMYKQNSDHYEFSETSDSGYDSDNKKCFCNHAESIDYNKY